MSIVITSFTAEHIDAVRAFNRRLLEGGIAERFPISNQFPDDPVAPWLPYMPGRHVYHEYYLAVEEGVVRGGYILKHQDFRLAGQVASIAQFKMPLSEGLVDPRYASVGVQLLLDAVRRQPLLYTLGIGAVSESVAKMLVAAGWTTWPVPFFFRVHRPSGFLRNITYLRRSKARRVALDLLAGSGLGAVGVRALQAWRTRGARRVPVPDYAVVPAFDDWADQLWHEAQAGYSLIAVRDSATLDLLYPEADTRFIRLKVEEHGEAIGWAVLLNAQMIDHNFFGNMRVGSLVDCLARPGCEGRVAAAARHYLERNRVDLMLANLSHRSWREALSAAGFMTGPSNYLFAASRKLSQALAPIEENRDLTHWTRGDGSGPENLFGPPRRLASTAPIAVGS